MRIAGSVLTLICGIVVLVGVFLPWFDIQVGFISISGSGWDSIDMNGIANAKQAFMVLLAGILMIGCALTSFIVSMVTGGGKAAVVTLSAIASVFSLVALGGAIWFIIDILTAPGQPTIQFDIIGYGVYISAAAALVGMIFAFTTMSAAIAARPRPRPVRVAPAPAPAATAAATVAPPPPPPPPPPAPEAVVEEVAEEPAPVVAEEAPPAEEVVEDVTAEEVPEEEITEAVAPAAAAAPAADRLAPKKTKKPVEKKVKKASVAEKPEGVDESMLPMVQQPWETSAEFKARKMRVKGK